MYNGQGNSGFWQASMNLYISIKRCQDSIKWSEKRVKVILSLVEEVGTTLFFLSLFFCNFGRILTLNKHATEVLLGKIIRAKYKWGERT